MNWWGGTRCCRDCDNRNQQFSATFGVGDQIAIPDEGRFTIKVTEKMEDLMSALFLSLYFTLSGLNINLGFLNNSGYLDLFNGRHFDCLHREVH